MTRSRTLACTAGIAALAFLAGMPALRAADAPVTLLRTFKKGDVTKYQAEITGKLGDVDFTVSSSGKSEVTEVKDNGDVSTLETEETTKVVAMGMDQPSKLSPPYTVTRDKVGKIKSTDGEIGDGQVFTRELALTLLEVGEPVLSDKPVTVGQTWETERDNPFINGKKFMLKTTLEAVEKDGDKTLWKVRQTADVEAPEGQPLKNDTAFWLDSANGRMVKVESTGSGIPTPLGVMSWTEKRTMQK